jgi:hypothetical protein
MPLRAKVATNTRQERIDIEWFEEILLLSDLIKHSHSVAIYMPSGQFCPANLAAI